jgi:hypothetical protein
LKRTRARLDSSFAYAAVGASVLAIPASAAALATPATQSGSDSPIKVRVKRSRLRYGRDVVVVGQAPSSDQGQTVSLQFWPQGTGGWEQLASASIGSAGKFRLIASLKRSGWLRAAVAAPAASASALSSQTAASGVSVPKRVAVEAAIHVHDRAISDFGAHAIGLRGRLLPKGRGRKVLLQADRSGRWITLSSDRTDYAGDFRLSYRPGDVGRERLRVRFAGDRANTAVSARAGSLTVYHQAVASWYYDGGTTGCGFHAYYGVANVSLPCGTVVSFAHGGRTVQAVVDDRGPYVGGRTWDLNQNTAAALGFGGVGAVWSSR